MWGMQLPMIGWANLEGGGMAALPAAASAWVSSSCSPLHARARDRLIGAHDNPAHAGGVVQGLERDDHLDGRAVGVGDDPLVPGDVVGIDLGHDERNVWLHAKGARVVDDHRPGGRGDRAPLPGDAARSAREHDVDVLKCAFGDRLDRDEIRRGRSPSCPRFARTPET